MTSTLSKRIAAIAAFSASTILPAPAFIAAPGASPFPLSQRPARLAHEPATSDEVTLAAAVTSVAALPNLSQRHRAYDWATAQRGCWYAYGGAGPCSRGFDCSGLVWAAYRSVGRDLPRTTYEMLASGMLRRVRGDQIRKGDLAFYGSGHVELWDRWHWTFGASTSGTRVGYHYWARGAAWRPTAVYRVIDAG